jgi:hypothetical protein
MLKHRFALAVGVLIALALPMVAQSGADAARRRGGAARVKVKKQVLRPTRLLGSGGDVYLAVQVSKARAQVTEVRAQAKLTGGGGGPVVTLSRQGKRFQGTCRVPTNYNRAATSAAINLYITTTDGTEPTWQLATVSVGPGNDSLPPPPPAY